MNECVAVVDGDNGFSVDCERCGRGEALQPCGKCFRAQIVGGGESEGLSRAHTFTVNVF